jgi:hypothetical protein
LGGLCDRCGQDKRKDFSRYGETGSIELLLGNGPRTRRCKATGIDKEEEEEEEEEEGY